MAKVRNTSDEKVVTPLPELRRALASLKPGEKVQCPNTREEILRIRENLTRNRAEIVGADDHIDYIEAMIVAEAEGNLEFRK